LHEFLLNAGIAKEQKKSKGESSGKTGVMRNVI
jgi:hypothetical protein